MASGDTVSGAVNIQKVQDDILKLWSLSGLYPKSAQTRRTILNPCMKALCVHWTIRIRTPHSTPRSHCSSSQFLQPHVTGVTAITSLSSDKILLLHLKHKVSNTWEYSSNLTSIYLLRIFGAVKNKKTSHHFVTQPTQLEVIPPLSPNLLWFSFFVPF